MTRQKLRFFSNTRDSVTLLVHSVSGMSFVVPITSYIHSTGKSFYVLKCTRTFAQSSVFIFAYRRSG